VAAQKEKGATDGGDGTKCSEMDADNKKVPLWEGGGGGTGTDGLVFNENISGTVHIEGSFIQVHSGSFGIHSFILCHALSAGIFSADNRGSILVQRLCLRTQ